MSQMRDLMGAMFENRLAALQDSRIGTVKREATGECAPSATGVLRVTDRLPVREMVAVRAAARRISGMILCPEGAPMSRKNQTATTTNREALARAGADFVGPMMRDRAPGLVAPAPDRPVRTATQAQVPVSLDRVLTVREVALAQAADAPAGHLRLIMDQALAAVGAIVTGAKRVPTGRRAQDPIVHTGGDEPVAMSAVPIDRSLVRQQVRPTGREGHPACLGTMAMRQDGAAGRDLEVRDGLAVASVRAATLALRVSEGIQPEVASQGATDELIADRASPEDPAASEAQVPAVHGLEWRPISEARVATVAREHNAILDSAVPAGQRGSAVGEALGLAGADAMECAVALDRVALREVLGRADLVVSGPIVSAVVLGVMALPAGGRVSVRAKVAGQVVGPDAAGTLVRRVVFQALAPVVLALHAWVRAEVSAVGGALGAPALTDRDGVAPADRDRGSRALTVHAVSAAVQGAMAAIAVLQIVSIVIAILVRTGHEASAVAGLTILKVLAVVWGAHPVAMAISVPAADSPAHVALASIAVTVRTTGRRSTKTSTAAPPWLASRSRRGTETNGA